MRGKRPWTVVALALGDRAALQAHFLALDSEDRRLRFGVTLRDERIAAYVDGIDFDADTVLGVHDYGGSLVGAAHLARTGRDGELGLSVLPACRNRGIGNALLCRAAQHARSVGLERLFMHCLAENGAVVHLARKNRMRIGHEQGEANAWLELFTPVPDRTAALEMTVLGRGAPGQRCPL